MRVRSALKGVLETALIQSGIAAASRIRSRSRVLVLAYHNIVPDDLSISGDRSLHLPRRQFADQLDLLVETSDVVPLNSILSAPTTTVRPRIAITFDDAYRGAVRLGVEELKKRGLPATIFVAPAFIGGRSFWWDMLVEYGRGRSRITSLREIALARCRGEDQKVRDYALQCGVAERAPDEVMLAATENELRDIAGVPEITLGSHTWSHPNLLALSPAEIRSELTESLLWLRERFDNVVPWLSYPYGLSSEAVELIASETGYTAALRVSGGWLPERPVSLFRLPRFNVPSGMSTDGFALRIAGLFAGGEA